MDKAPFRIGVVAPASPIHPDVADKVKDLCGAEYGPSEVEISFHSQCFAEAGHFAGPDALRAAAFVEMAEDPAIDAVWFARGGYGSARILDLVMESLTGAARAKTYLGYSDLGALMGALMSRGFENLFHGPVPIETASKPEAVRRALRFLVERDPEAVEPSVVPGGRYAAFNLATLMQLVGTPYMPDLSDHILMIEDVDEYLYRTDRMLFQLMHAEGIRNLKGLRLGRFSGIPENTKPFGESLEEMVKRWCDLAGVPYLGAADIGHDEGNKVVPLGLFKPWAR